MFKIRLLIEESDLHRHGALYAKGEGVITQPPPDIRFLHGALSGDDDPQIRQCCERLKFLFQNKRYELEVEPEVFKASLDSFLFGDSTVLDEHPLEDVFNNCKCCSFNENQSTARVGGTKSAAASHVFVRKHHLATHTNA